MFATVLVCFSTTALANQIGFDEQFVLSENREPVLRELIPGSEDYYYYHCIHYQNEKQFDKAKSMLDEWIKRYGYNNRVETIRNRQTFFEFANKPGATFDFLRERLRLTFSHQKQRTTTDPHLPTNLNPNLISYQAFLGKAVARRNNLHDFETNYLYKINPSFLTPTRRRDLLSKLTRPDYPNLAQEVIRDLRHQNSRGFGSFNIHSQLTIAQLYECKQLMPDLKNTQPFIQAFINKLHPESFIDWENDKEEKENYLKRLWNFVQTLPQAQNSLKAHVLYHLLDFQRSNGQYETELFIEYIKLPRNSGWVNSHYLRQHRSHRVNLNTNFKNFTLLDPVHDDSELVRDYFENILAKKPNFNRFKQYINHEYLQEVFASAKLLHDKGKPEDWHSMLSPAKLAELRDRVEINILPTSPKFFSENDKVSVDVAIKNVNNLFVRVYEINTQNYYRENLSEITTAIDLDGLIANYQYNYTYDKPAFVRHKNSFDFPELERPGVYVIEFIGNGLSSRALIRKSRLTFAQRIGAAGHVMTVLNSQAQPVIDAKIWLKGRTFEANNAGEITVPFSTEGGKTKFIIKHGNFAQLAEFEHLEEDYQLEVGFYVNREHLIKGETASFVFSPRLYIHNQLVDISILDNLKASVKFTDREEASSQVQKANIKQDINSDYVLEARIPEDTRKIELSMTATLATLNTGETITLSDSTIYELNAADLTDRIKNILVFRDGENFIACLKGKNGEARSDETINVEVKHSHFVRPEKFVLKTDRNGQINLGELKDIEQVKLSAQNGSERTFKLPHDKRLFLQKMHVNKGDDVIIPIMSSDASVSEIVSVFRKVGATYIEDLTHLAKINEGFLYLNNLSQGEYEIYIKPQKQTIQLLVVDGKRYTRHIITQDALLERTGIYHLNISDVSIVNDKLRIKLDNVTPSTRVHISATRFFPELSMFSSLKGPRQKTPDFRFSGRHPSEFVSGRSTGDEYRYILERQAAGKFAGNMLERPSLLLNPFSLGTTETGVDRVRPADAWEESRRRTPQARSHRPHHPKTATRVDTSMAIVNLDFLDGKSFFAGNIKPDVNHQVLIDINKLNNARDIRIYVSNLQSAIVRNISLPAISEEYRDLRMKQAFDKNVNYTRQKNISSLKKNDLLKIDDISTSKVEIYDDIASVFRFYSTVSNEEHLKDFSFITEWKNLCQDKKQEYYSDFACHELNFFIYNKDPKFFGKVVKPYIHNKKDKTFLDKWLLDMDLSKYIEPWHFNRLNAVEKILLAKKVQEHKKGISKYISNSFELLREDADVFNRLFDAAVISTSTDADDRLGLHKAQQKAIQKAAMPVKRAPAPRRAPAREMADTMSFASAPMIEADGFLAEELGADLERRERPVPGFYDALPTTEEWVENNYYKLPIKDQNESLIKINAFWKDFAVAQPEKPFLSGNFIYATNSFTEMMFAMAVLDLEFEKPEHLINYDQTSMTIKTESNAIVFHQEVKPCNEKPEAQTILISQHFFDNNDRYETIAGQKTEKFLTGGFGIRNVYGSVVAVTNPTSSHRTIELLLQIPNGALPVKNGFFTTTRTFELKPFSTRNIEYFFYFPKAGRFDFYPAQAAEDSIVIASAEPTAFKVTDEPATIDKTTWRYVSQNSSDNEVIEFLKATNIKEHELSMIYFRLRNKTFFTQLTQLLSERFIFDDVVWSYSIFHENKNRLKEYIAFTSLPENVGRYLDTAVLTVNPVERRFYEHKEYYPLVNARTFQPEGRKTILNRQLFNQYTSLLETLRYKQSLSDEDRMAIAYYMLLQDRISEAIEQFKMIQTEQIKQSISYKYFNCWILFSKGHPEKAVEIANDYLQYPVKRWRLLFKDVVNQYNEIQTGVYSATDPKSRTHRHLHATEILPTLEIELRDNAINIAHTNVENAQINFYLMDLEFLFSNNPFVQDVSERFLRIYPNKSLDVSLSESNTTSVKIPDSVISQNSMIEVVAGGIKRSTPYFPNSMRLVMMESFGQLQVFNSEDNSFVPGAYVKVYARMKNGQTQFYKDGYTDLRGRFDYESLSTDATDRVERFAILVYCQNNGSIVREAAPAGR